MFPFFSRRAGLWVVDEVCQCGHARKDHGSKLIRCDARQVRQSNEGSCTRDCDCKAFTWASWAYAKVPVEVSVEVKKDSV
jgi:hypothetical protein